MAHLLKGCLPILVSQGLASNLQPAGRFDPTLCADGGSGSRGPNPVGA